MLSFRKTLRKQLERGEPWPEEGGYVDGVVDLRDPQYIRYYVGQSIRLPIRLAIEHPKYIRNGDTRSLHYFVLARGRGQRSAQFLRLWHSTNLTTASGNPARRLLLRNILEMSFCRFFESLPTAVLTQFFGPAKYSNVGLNNLPPLFEGRNIPSFLRAGYLEHHRESLDPDISAFVDIRKEQNLKQKNAKREATSL